MISLSSNLQERQYKHPLKFLIQAEIQRMFLTKFMWRGVCWWRVMCVIILWRINISVLLLLPQRPSLTVLLSYHLQVIEELARPQTHCCSNCSCFFIKMCHTFSFYLRRIVICFKSFHVISFIDSKSVAKWLNETRLFMGLKCFFYFPWWWPKPKTLLQAGFKSLQEF